MITYPDIDPVAFSLGPLQIHWYGLMYLIAFGLGWWLGRVRARDPRSAWRAEDVDDVLFYVAVGVVAGGRLGYVLFYDFASMLADPTVVFRVWQGGMSFHGGLIGVIVSMLLFARSRRWRFFAVADFIAPLVPLGIAAGRVGNFINGNLWGKPTDLPWGMVFPQAGDLPRHPSQLYQALLEGVLLFVVVWTFSRRPRPAMAVSGVFLAAYGVFRFLIEFVRVPDSHIGYVAFGWLTLGQVLTLPMAAAGLALLALAYRRTPENGAGATPATSRPPGSVETKRGRR